MTRQTGSEAARGPARPRGSWLTSLGPSGSGTKLKHPHLSGPQFSSLDYGLTTLIPSSVGI